MCGFLGQFGGRIAEERQAELASLLSLSRTRGPDETRVYTNCKDLWLGFNRLAILDVSSAGSQPMISPSGRFTIVFNGEIYNHLRLREKLPFRVWRGRSDTETILACIEEWGFEKTLEALDGMFALAAYDSVEKVLLCARDFAGIKPFFYGSDGEIFVFASQYDQITSHPLFRDNPVDGRVLRLYLEQHFIPAPFGLVRRTGQLEPGQWCRVSASGIEKGFFWRFPEYVEPAVRDHDTALKVLETELAASVSDEMLSDVPLGGFLSGGIDSPLICHYAARNSTEPLRTFTIGSDSSVHDEEPIAREYASLIGTRHQCDRMTADSAIAIFDNAMDCVREPMADFSVIPTWLVSKLARKHVTVALSGDGGDELFFGYERFRSIAKNVRLIGLPWLVRAAAYKADKFLSSNANINGAALAVGQAAAHRGLHSRFSGEWIDRLFPDLRGVSTPDEYDVYGYADTGKTNELIQFMRKAEFYGMMQKTLRKVDLASMGVALEVRVPFLKKSFIEAALRIDPNLSYGPGKKKQLLKDLLSKLYPTAPIDNIKRGFAVPLGRWLSTPNFRDRVAEDIVQDHFTGRFGIDRDAAAELVALHGLNADQKWPIFTMLVLERQSRSRGFAPLPVVQDQTLQVSYA